MNRVSRFEKKHFRSKDIAAQQTVHELQYPEYREVKALEVMTMALLYDLAHKEQLLPDYVRCEEHDAFGGRVCVGRSVALGLRVLGDLDVYGHDLIGRALGGSYGFDRWYLDTWTPPVGGVVPLEAVA